MTVLLIDDEPDVFTEIVQPAVAAASQKADLEMAARVIPSIEDARQLFAEFRKSKSTDVPKVIVLDMDISNNPTGGLELLQQIKEIDALRSVPVLMYSQHKGNDLVCACLSHGAEGYLHKFGRKRKKKELMTSSLFYLASREVCKDEREASV